MLSVRYLALAFVVAFAAAALAQEEEHYHEPSLQFDSTVSPLLQPMNSDFMPDEGEKTGEKSATSVGAFTEVTSAISMISIAPSYRFSPAFRARVRLPWILNRTFQYFQYEASSSGLGDISVEGDYLKKLAGNHHQIQATLALKLPTGDHEKVEEGEFGTTYRTPLGTGSVDILARGQYARRTKDTGLLATALFRRNAAGEIITEFASSIPGENVISTDRYTSAGQFTAGAFGRRRVNEKLWVHLGLSLMITGDGSGETEYDDPAAAGPTTTEYDDPQGGTLVDLYPGVSYKIGIFTPYLGIRIPVMTSFDNEGLDDSRDAAVVLQVSYNPARLVD